VRANGSVPIAGGENVVFDPVRGDPRAAAALPLDIVQPDITKNCRLHDALALVRAARKRKIKVYPHVLGSGPAQAASLHLAAGCGQTMLEWDINPNPLRTDLFEQAFEIADGRIRLPESPGLGWELDEAAVERFRVS
jgi:D-galactarolactone cycloisomerase